MFSLAPPGSAGEAWTETVLHSFNGGDGNNPVASLVASPGGVLYGTTAGGGASEAGTVFSLSPPASAGDLGPKLLSTVSSVAMGPLLREAWQSIAG